MYTLENYLTEALVPQPADFAKHLPMTFTPRPDQVVGLNRKLVNTRFGLFDDPGVGKTVQIQASAMQMIAAGNKVLLLMPPVLLGQFVESLVETFRGVENHVSWHVLCQGPAAREKLYAHWSKTDEWPDMMLMSYEMFVVTTRIPKGTKGRPWFAHALREVYRVVDCDEGHKLCGHDTLLHSQLDWHCGEPEESMLCISTGTPMPLTPLNAYGLIHLLNPPAYKDYNQFERLHGVFKKIRLSEPRRSKSGKEQEWITVLDGFRDLPEIRKNLYAYGRRVIKEQVLDLKEPQIIETTVMLGDEHMRLYKQLEKERILEWKGQIIAGGMNEQRLRQALLRIVTNPEAFMPDGKKIYNAVLDMTLEIIQGHNDARPLEDGFPNKILVFCNLRPTARFLAEALAAYKPVVINGETTNKDAARKTFLEDPACRLAICNPESAGFGLNFQGVSCTNIFVEPTSSPGEFKQAMERTYRNRQDRVVQTYILRAKGTIAPKATMIMLERTGDINEVNRDSVILSSYYRRD